MDEKMEEAADARERVLRAPVLVGHSGSPTQCALPTAIQGLVATTAK